MARPTPARRLRAVLVLAGALTVMSLVGWPRIVAPTFRRWRPEFRHPLRVVFPFQDNAIARAKAALPRYTWPHHTPFPPPIYVVSLKRSAKRRAAIAAQMESRGINFTFFDAVDGVQQLLPDADVKWYASGARWRGYATEPTGGFWHRKMGCDLSHFRLMHQMLAGNDEMQIVLEDDALLLYEGDDWLMRLRAVVEQLPNDWEILWLNHGLGARSTALPLVGQGVRLHLYNTQTVGVMYRRSFAFKVLHDARIGDKEVDNLLNDLGSLGLAAAYVADPAFVGLGAQSQISTINDDLRRE